MKPMPRRKNRLACVVLMALAVMGALSLVLSPVAQPSAQELIQETLLEDAKLEQQAQKLFRGLRCLVCEAEALASSPAPFARELRQAIREQLLAGADADQIHAWLYESYGAAIFLTPPLTRATAFLWFAPFGLVGLILAAWLVVVLGKQVGTRGAHKKQGKGKWWSRGESNP